MAKTTTINITDKARYFGRVTAKYYGNTEAAERLLCQQAITVTAGEAEQALKDFGIYLNRKDLPDRVWAIVDKGTGEITIFNDLGFGAPAATRSLGMLWSKLARAWQAG